MRCSSILIPLYNYHRVSSGHVKLLGTRHGRPAGQVTLPVYALVFSRQQKKKNEGELSFRYKERVPMGIISLLSHAS